MRRLGTARAGGSRAVSAAAAGEVRELPVTYSWTRPTLAASSGGCASLLRVVAGMAWRSWQESKSGARRGFGQTSMPSFRRSRIAVLRQRVVSGENGSVKGIPLALRSGLPSRRTL